MLGEQTQTRGRSLPLQVAPVVQVVRRTGRTVRVSRGGAKEFESLSVEPES